MRKIRLILLLGIFLASIPLLAQTETDAKSVALNFLKQKKGNVKLELSSAKVDVGSTAAKAKSVGGASTESTGDVYAFNVQGGGFALVCTGNGNTAVAGYSDTGSIDVDNMPEAMKVWLASYQMAMGKTKTLETKEPSWIGPTVSPVKPLIKTQWGQGTPYNGKCPSDGKQTALAGSEAVALAQVLNYYHQDRTGGGSLSYAHIDSETEYDIDYSTTKYDWANMLNSYKGNFTQAQANAVGKLILESGIACKANYGYTGTSASLPFVALNKYYNYDCMYVDRQYTYNHGWGYGTDYHYVSTQKWMEMIQGELTEGRPIIYFASDLYRGAGIIAKTPKSHTFIIDGIDSQNYVHCNWGWNGVDDGYYDVALLNPESVSYIYDAGFRASHTMIIGIKPHDGYYEERIYQSFVPFDWTGSGPGWIVKSKENSISTFAVESGEVVASKGAMYFELVANSYEDLNYPFTIVLTKGDEVVCDLNNGGSYNTKVPGWDSYFVGNLYHGFSKVPSGIKDGTYDIRVGFYGKNGFELCPAPKQIIPTVDIVNEGTGMVFHGLEGYDIDYNLSLEDIKPASEIYAGTTFYLYLTGKGSSRSAKLNFRNVETGKLYGEYSGASSQNSFSFTHRYDGYTSTIACKFVPKNTENGFSMPAGRYKVELPEDVKAVTLAKDFYIDVKEKPSYPILDGIDLAWCYFWSYNYNETNSLGYNPLKNTKSLKTVQPQFQYANKVEEPVTVNVYMVNRDDGSERLVACLKNWVPNQKRPLGLVPYPLSGNYEFKCRYLTPDGERASLMPTENYEREPYYNYKIEEDVNGLSSPCELVSWSKKTSSVSSDAVGANQFNTKVQLNLKVSTDRYDKGYVITNNAVVKALFFDKESKEVIVDSVTNVIIANMLISSYTLTPQLTDDAKYSVCILYNDYNYDGSSDNEYSYVLNTDHSIAEFELTNDGTTDIARVSTFNSIFKQGETVRVYDMNGILVKTLTASSDLWSNLLSTLPSGVFVLKSSTQTIKFRK